MTLVFAPKNLAAVVAHPDDEVLCCGGTLARHRAANGAVHILILATGAAARYAGEAPSAEIKALRAAADEAANRLGGAQVQFADFPDNRMDSVPLLDVVKRVEAFLADTGADAVITHHPGDINVDHGVAARAVLTATRPLPGARVRVVLAGETLSASEWGYSAERFAPNVYVDIAASLEAKRQAMAAYAAELRAFPHPRSIEAIEHLARLRGSECGHAAAEAFALLRQVV